MTRTGNLCGRKVRIATRPSYPSKQALSVSRGTETDEYKHRCRYAGNRFTVFKQPSRRYRDLRKK